MDPKEFSNPGRQYRGVALWMLNDKLEVGEIERQLDGMASAGWGAVIGRTFVGLRTEYLSDEWMEIIAAVVAGCRRHGMKAWLQAGHMPSAVPDLPIEIAHHVLVRLPKGTAAPASAVVLAEDESFLYCRKPLENVLDLLNEQAVVEYLDAAYEKVWAGRFGGEFGKTIEAVWVDEPHFRPPPLPWSRDLPGIFRKKWGYALTDHLPGLFAPSGDYRKVRHQYWRTVLELFLKGYFRNVGKWCAEHKLKFSGHLMGEDTLNNQIAWTGAGMPAYQYMHLPGIDHLTRSLYWPSQKKFILTPKQCSSAANQAGQAEVLAETYGVSSHSLSFEDRKQISDWMAILGINYRCYHGYFYSMRGRRKRVYVPHLSYQQPWWRENRVAADYFARVSYALRGGRFDPEVLVIHPVESAFCLYDPTTMDRPHDRSTETAEMKARDDEMVAIMDHLLSLHRGFELGDETMLSQMGKVAGRSFRVGKMSYKAVLLPSMITIRRTTLALLKKFAAAGGKVLGAGELATRLDGEMDPKVTEELAKIVTPVANEPAEMKAALDAALPVQVDVSSRAGGVAKNVWTHLRRVKQGRLCFLANTSRLEPAQVRVRIRGAGKLQSWDPRTGKIANAPQKTEGDFVVTDLALAPLGSALLLLDEKARAADVEAQRTRLVREIELGPKGIARRRDPNALVLDLCRYRKGGGDWSGTLPVIRVQELLEKENYQGPLTLQFAFRAEFTPKVLSAVIEDAALYDIRVNGQRCRGLPPSVPTDAATTGQARTADRVVASPSDANHGTAYYVDRSFHPVDIASAVRVGENTIELSVDFRPVSKAAFALASLFEVNTGTELETLYLVGDFGVRGAISPRPARARCVRRAPDFALVPEKKAAWCDLSAAAYPFYAGRFTFEEAVDLPRPAKGQKVFVELPGVDAAVAKVRVNGAEAGAIAWAPYEVEITPLVKGGRNRIEIELVGTLRNLMGPHHRATGEPDDCWRTAFNYTAPGEPAEHAEEAEGAWTDDYFVVHFGLRGKARVKYVAGR